MSDYTVEERLEGCRRELLKNSIFFCLWCVLALLVPGFFQGMPNRGAGITSKIGMVAWAILGLPKVWKALLFGLMATVKPDYEVVTVDGHGNRISSDGGAQSMQMNIIWRLIFAGVMLAIGGIITLFHLVAQTISYLILNAKASVKPAFIKSGLFIIVLNLIVFVGTFVVGYTVGEIVTGIKVAQYNAEHGVKTTGDFESELNETKDGIIIRRYKGKGGSIVIPDTIDGLPVVGIGGSFLTYDTKSKVTQVTLPKNLKFIQALAFDEGVFTSIAIPEGVTDIANSFTNCKNLTSVTLPQSLRRIGGAFENCTSLTDVTIPSGTTITYGIHYASDPGNTVRIADMGYFKKDDDSSPLKADTFKGCSKLSAKSRQAIKDSGYEGDF